MPCRVLIVEDDDAFAEILALLLENDGHFSVVGRARDGAEAMALTREHAPDVLTMDIDMPRVDGVEATAAIVARHPGQRIVVVSGSVFSDRIEEARRAGAAGYVAKSKAVDELPAVLLAACRGSAFVAVA
jgi:DNA-binding NarL/FixJ family response regulator